MNTYGVFDTISDRAQSISPWSSFVVQPAFDAWVRRKQIELKNQTRWEKKAGGRLRMEVARRLVFSASRRDTRGRPPGSISSRFAGAAAYPAFAFAFLSHFQLVYVLPPRKQASQRRLRKIP